MEDREQRERGGGDEAQKQREERQREEVMRVETTDSAEEEVAENGHSHRNGHRRWRRDGYISITLQTQEGAYDKHLPDWLRLGGYCGLC